MKIRIAKSIAEISQAQWQTLNTLDFPFAEYQFLKALEDTDCVGSRTGWNPVYLLAENAEKLSGVYILYLKTNSYGEFIFDFGWAHAHEGLGLDYYPKLVSAIPFTPATGSKILFAQDLSAEEKKQMSLKLLAAAQDFFETTHLSSTHDLFIPENELELFEEAGHLIRHSYQYHWKNQSYRSFEEFLQALRSKRRKEILRERAQVTESGVKIQRLTGNSLTKHHADLMYTFYLSTIDKMAGFDYLTEEFFHFVFEKMKDQILFVLATNPHGEEVAGAVNFFNSSTLYGRHWGCLENYRSLHFEVCYYQGIEFAIEKGMSLFEAGAQGEHKFQRGFLPTLTYSAHQIKNPRLQRAIQDFIEQEKLSLRSLFSSYESHSPFSRASSPLKTP